MRLRNGGYTENYTATLTGAVERGAIVGAESGVVLSKIAGEANLTVTLQWDPAKPDAR